MMQKEFVSYEHALALKELGFNEPCFGKYDIYGSFDHKLFYHNHDSETSLNCSAPTFSQALKWFREKHDLQYWLNDGGYLGKCFIKITGYKHDKFYFSSSEPMEYEEAEQECLKKLIEIVKDGNTSK